VIAYDNLCLIGDCRDSMHQMIADGVRVQMCVTSPPYWGLRDYGHEGQIGLEPTIRDYIDALVGVFGFVRELLADNWTLWLNLGDCYAGSWGAQSREHAGKHAPNVSALSANQVKAAQIRNGTGSLSRTPGLKSKDLVMMPARIALALQENGWWVRQDIIWHKPNPMPESVTDRCTKAHEYLFLLSKSERYYFDAEAIKEPQSENTHERFGKNGKRTGEALKQTNSPNGMIRDKAAYSTMILPNGRNKRSVWTIASQPYSQAHFATFPPALVEPCILAGSRVGDVVLDPFFGSGTVGEVAQRLGRKWIGCDLQEAYAPMQAKRTAQQGFEL
jgi:DNA modification methylase